MFYMMFVLHRTNRRHASPVHFANIHLGWVHFWRKNTLKKYTFRKYTFKNTLSENTLSKNTYEHTHAHNLGKSSWNAKLFPPDFNET